MPTVLLLNCLNFASSRFQVDLGQNRLEVTSVSEFDLKVDLSR